MCISLQTIGCKKEWLYLVDRMALTITLAATLFNKVHLQCIFHNESNIANSNFG